MKINYNNKTTIEKIQTGGLFTIETYPNIVFMKTQVQPSVHSNAVNLITGERKYIDEYINIKPVKGELTIY